MKKSIAYAALAAALAVVPALAHHSFAMFDNSRLDTLSGVVEDFEFINPHSWIHLAVTGESGGTNTWSFEMTGTNFLIRDGWSGDTIGAGDNVEISFHPMKDGSYGGQFRSIVLPDGSELCQGGAGPVPCSENPNF